MTIKFRWHRGTLKESMKTMETFEDKDALIKYIVKESAWFEKITEKDIQCRYAEHDGRIDWETYIISTHNGVLGMTNKRI